MPLVKGIAYFGFLVGRLLIFTKHTVISRRNTMKYISVFIVIFSIIISGCATAPEAPPTSTPKPTWTSRPHGILRACIYFDNELVDLGYLSFKNEQVDLEDLDATLIGGCKDVLLPPGSYNVIPHYYQGDCSDSTAICRSEEFYQIEILDGEVIELDFEVFYPD
jgi:hypothetical protein